MAAHMRTASVTKFGESTTTSLLPAVISTLSSSNETLKDHERKELEKKYDESGKKLDTLLQDHHEELGTLINAFTCISDKLKESRERVANIKENLLSCKNLLHCKRDELRKFWLEALEQNAIYDMLEQVERIRGVPEQLEHYTSKKLYLHATNTLCDSLSLLRNDLRDVTALKDVAVTLAEWKQILLQKLVDEMHHQIYVKSVKGTVMAFKRLGSIRKSGKGKGGSVVASAQEQNLANWDIYENENSDPEEDRSHFLAILVECLAKLNEVPIAELRSHLQSELQDVIRRASQQFVDSAYQQGEINLSTHEQPLYLLELLELVFEQFRCVVHAHNVIIRNLKRVKSSRKYGCENLALYDITEVWSKIQVVIEQMLSVYLVDNEVKKQRKSRSLLASDTEPPPAVTDKVDINTFFNRRRPLQRKAPLFTFSGTKHSISLEKYLLEQRNAGYESGDATYTLLHHSKRGDVTDDSGFASQPLNLVCEPKVTNITAIYKALEGFTGEVEMAIGCDPGECNLHRYMTSFIKNEFNSYVQQQMERTVKEETERFDHLKNLVDGRRLKQLGSTMPLLVSSVKVMEFVFWLTNLMQDLPDYCDHFLSQLIKLLIDYHSSCTQSYTGVVKSGHDQDHIVVSATWATDEDISRFLRSLPNWQHLQYGEDTRLAISDDERKSLNLKESEILTTNLSQQDSVMPSHEILSDPIQLKLLAHLHESLEWMTLQLKRYLSSMPVEGSKPAKTVELLEIPEIEKHTYETLSNIVDNYKELADTCLLLLHLEVRVHCFYHLMPVAKQSNYYCPIDDMDADSNVVKLNRDLTGVEEVMKQSMQPRKFRYIFEGLGHLVASLLINSVQYLKRINGNGVKKMCRNIFAIRQSLTNVMSTSETDLDLARQYYELLNLSIEQIIDAVREGGSKFTELEYMHLLRLLQRSQPAITDEYFKLQAQKLKQTITEKHVYHV